jgi:trigger factor
MTHLSPNEELMNDEVRVSVQKKDSCQVEFLVTASKNLMQKARLDAAKAVNKEVVLPGFRKGKAPDSLILKKFPYEIEKRYHKSLADLAFIEAQKLAKIPVLNNSSTITFDMKKSSEEGAELQYTFETEPTVPSVDAKLFVPQPVAKKEVGEKEVNEAIRQMSFFYAKWEQVEDRPVQEGDFIMIDLDTVEGEETKRVFDKVRFEVKPERMAQWMRNLVLQAKVGDVLDGVSEPDDTATEEEKREFLPKKVRIHVCKVERAVLPEMNDEFAKKVGAPDVAGMHDLVQGVLRKQVEDKAQEDLREQVNHFLVTNYSFELPQSLIKAEFEHRFNQAKQNPEFVAHIEKCSDAEKMKIESRIREETIQSLRLFYLSKQIVQDAKISITHQEVNRRAVEHRRTNSMGFESGEQLSKEEYALALSMVFLSKAQDFIIEKQKA